MPRKLLKKSISIVIGDPPLGPSAPRGRSKLQKLAILRRKRYTAAERELELILNSLNNGILKGKFHREWTFAGKWIIDFFFYENRLGIEVDGGYHQSEEQRRKDSEKEKACEKFDITLIRLNNREVFGDRNILLQKLRDGWRKANQKIKK